MTAKDENSVKRTSDAGQDKSDSEFSEDLPSQIFSTEPRTDEDLSVTHQSVENVPDKMP